MDLPGHPYENEFLFLYARCNIPPYPCLSFVIKLYLKTNEILKETPVSGGFESTICEDYSHLTIPWTFQLFNPKPLYKGLTYHIIWVLSTWHPTPSLLAERQCGSLDYLLLDDQLRKLALRSVAFDTGKKLKDFFNRSWWHFYCSSQFDITVSEHFWQWAAPSKETSETTAGDTWYCAIYVLLQFLCIHKTGTYSTTSIL